MKFLYFLGFMCLWGVQVGASKAEPLKPNTTEEPTVTVTVTSTDPNDSVLKVKKGNETQIIMSERLIRTLPARSLNLSLETIHIKQNKSRRKQY
jgi:hypothetical protein